MHPRPAARILAILAAAIVTVGIAGTASAERLYTKQETPIRDRPGEQARVVVRVAPNRPVEVLARKGRWIQVKYHGKVGWLTRTTVRKSARPLTPAERRARIRRERERRHRLRRLGHAAHPQHGAHKKERRRRRRTRERAARKRRKQTATEGNAGGGAANAGSGDNAGGTGAANAGSGDNAGGTGGGSEAAGTGVPRSSWGGKHTPGGPIQVKVDVSSAKALARADTSAPVAFTVEKGQMVRAIGDHGDWVEIENQAGEKGWVSKDDVGDPGHLVQARKNIAPKHPQPVPGGPGVKKVVTPARPSRSRIVLSAGAAYSSLGLDYTSDAAMSAATVSGQAVGLGLRGAYTYRLSSHFMLGVDTSYLAGYGLSGFDYKSAGNDVSGIGFDLYDVMAAAEAGYRFGNMAVWLRAGGAYNSLFITDLGNGAKMPREEMLGATAGLAVTTHLGRLAAGVRFDYLAVGGRSQTAGLEDGTSVDSVSGLWGNAMVSYRLTSRYAVDARYQFRQMQTAWSGASSRISGAMSAKRTDTGNLVILGVGALF